ncbi:ABC transporter substrate-binding protein [Phormidesmis sp. 146-12]
MSKAIRRIFRLLLLVVITITFAVACRNFIPLEKESSNPVQEPSLAQMPTATKVVEHALGQVKIPLHPQRVIVMDGNIFLDPVLALGIKPVGIAPCSGCLEGHSGIDPSLTANIPNVGDEQPSLEKILQLKPDLILLHKYQQRIYPQLSAIAPTVVIDTDGGVDFEKNIRYIAQLLGKVDRVEAVLSEHRNKVKQLRQQLEPRSKTQKISVIQISGSNIYSVKPGLFPSDQILIDAGLQFLESQEQQQDMFLPVSLEALLDYDADILFVIVVWKRDAENLSSLSFLKHRIWSTLKAVQNKQIYAVQWAGIGGTIGADRVLNDLYRYLVKDS